MTQGVIVPKLPGGREPMATLPGMSIRKEIDLRLGAAREDARVAAFEEAIAFLGGSGYAAAAEALQRAAFHDVTEGGHG